MTVTKNYDEETDPRLKKMIDHVIEQSSLHQIKEDDITTDEQTIKQDKMLEEGKISEVFEEQIAWLKESGEHINLAICIPLYDGNVKIDLMSSLLMMVKPNFRLFYSIGHAIDAQRNELVQSALAWKEMTHILFVDADTILPSHGIIRLLQREKDMVSGFYMQNQNPFAPLVIKRPQHKETGKRMVNFFPNITPNMNHAVIKADASGGGALLIKREIFESISLPHFKTTLLPDSRYGKVMGEDVFFFDKAKDLGYQLYVDISVKCEHVSGRNSFPLTFLSGSLVRGEEGIKKIRTFNNTAMLYAGGYDVKLFHDLMEIEQQRNEKKSKEEPKKNDKNKSKKTAHRRKTTKVPA